MKSANRPRVLLTGASGYVGSAILKTLLESGHEVVATVWRRELQGAPNIETVRIDLAAHGIREEVKALPSFDVLVHCAGAPKFFAYDRAAMRMLNVVATMALAGECTRRGARFLHISTAFVSPEQAGVLGESKPGRRPPENYYEATKTEAELALLEAGGDFDIIRPPIVVPRADDPIPVIQSSPLGAFAAAALAESRRRIIPGCLYASLPMVQRNDIATAIREIIGMRKPEGCRWWNLCAPSSPTLAEVISQLCVWGIGASIDADGECPRRLLPWLPYLRGDRNWDTGTTARRLAACGVVLAPVSAGEIAACCAKLLPGRTRVIYA